ncbi:MAG: hypothetical protein JXR83_23460 [Deltaproteobacteria bacterium]|nr:hypothetical protein [Deltaproteobacteria bacterium]
MPGGIADGAERVFGRVCAPAFALAALVGGAGCDLVIAWSGGAGLRCSGDEACAPGQACIDHVCRSLDCDSDSDCPDGYRCGSGVCVVFSNSDAARPDANTSDTGIGDRTAPDAVGTDAIVPDAVVSDAMAADAGAADRTSVDRRDAGRSDHQIGDAADAAAAIDAASPDQGSPADSGNPCAVTIILGSCDLGCGVEGHFAPIWDLTRGDLTVRFTYDATGIEDEPETARTWAELGVRQVGGADHDPSGVGVWLHAIIDAAVGTLDPDPPASPVYDLDDRLLLQRGGVGNEECYDLPGPAPYPGNNHYMWFDRDGVDATQANSPLMIDGGSYNTQGIYQVSIALHATGATTGTAYLTVNGLSQGFEVDGNWNTIELTPAGMTWSGDMTQMQVFYGLFCIDANSTVAFNEITATGCLAE